MLLNDIPIKNGSKLDARLEGDRFNLTCISRGGKPAPRVTWWLGQQELTSSDRNRRFYIYDDVILQDDHRFTTFSTLELIVTREHLMNTQLECKVHHDSMDTPFVTWYQLDVQGKFS